MLAKRNAIQGFRTVVATLIGLVAGLGSAAGGGWPVDPGTNPIKRDAIDAVMEIVLEECPALAEATY